MPLRRFHLILRGLSALALIASAVPASAAPAAPDGVIPVQLDRATVLRMPPHAATIVVGNPIIADVTTLKSDNLVVVTGKGFGETNIIFLDNTGKAVAEHILRVTAATSLLTVQRGMDRESYSCRPRCEPTVSLGDSDTFIKGASGQISARNGLAVPTASH